MDARVEDHSSYFEVVLPAVAIAVSQNTFGIVADPTSKLDVVDDAAGTHNKRIDNILVYALAEKYNIPALKELAKTKFNKYKSVGDSSQYWEAINVIFDYTSDTDPDLRDNCILGAASAGNVENLLNEAALALVIRIHGSLGLGMLRVGVKKHKPGLEKQKQGFQDRNTELRLAVGRLHQDAMQIHIANKRDSQEGFRRSPRAFGRVQRELWSLWNPSKVENRNISHICIQVGNSLERESKSMIEWR